MPSVKINPHDYENTRLYPIGYKFTLKQGKRTPKECEVVDYAITYNRAGEVLKFRYVVGYWYALNNAYTTEEMVQITIDKATNNGWKELNQ